MKLTLLLDTTYLCHRAFYAADGLKHNSGNAVIAGVLREVDLLRDRYSTDQLVFCFDEGTGFREQNYPFYKASRRAKLYTPPEQVRLSRLRDQIKLVKEKVLADLGFQNICFEEGYEADDVIASIVYHHLDNETVIVSGDADLYQLLSPKVCMYNPRSKETATRESFRRHYRIPISAWPLVKALSGCQSDDIPGVPGVGLKSALRYIREELDVKSRAYQLIEENRNVWEEYLKLTQLPYFGCPRFPVQTQGRIDPRVLREALRQYSR